MPRNAKKTVSWPTPQQVQQHHRTLLDGAPVQAKATPGKGNGLFATIAIEEGTVLFTDEPLGWQPREGGDGNCTACGRFFGTASDQLHRLMGGAGEPIDVPPIPDQPAASSVWKDAETDEAAPVCCGMCAQTVRRSFAASTILLNQQQQQDELMASWSANQFLLLGAQLVAALVSSFEAASTADRAAGVHLLPLAALASPSWREAAVPDEGMSAAVHRRAIETELSASLSMLREAYAEPLRRHPELAAVLDDELWARAVGACARNSISVQVPHPLVYYISHVDALPPNEPLRGKAQARLASGIATLLQAEAEAEEEGEEEEESDEEEEAEGEEDEDGEEEDDDDSDEDSDEEDEEEEEHFEWSLGGADLKEGGERVLKFSSRLFPPHKGFSVYPRVSLANHSCEPNCQVAYMENNQALLVSLRDLGPGEEVSISYVSAAVPYAERQAKLRARYGFTCICSLCRAEAAEEAQEAAEQAPSQPTAKRVKRS